MFRRWGFAAVGASALTLIIAAPATAHPPMSHHHNPTVTQVNQVSDQEGVALVHDPNLVNSWGLALGPTTPLWVANNGTNTATVYSGGLGGHAVGIVPLVVKINGGAPTGEVFNDTNDFKLRTPKGKKVPATFIFDSEGGDITAWNRDATGTTAVVKAHVEGAVFKGLAIWHTRFGNFLLAADFIGGVLRVFDRNFHEVKLPKKFFRDPKLPAGYAPFNVMTVGETVYVSYAQQVPGSEDEAHGPGLGFVDRFTHVGLVVKRIASRGTLNAPWGMAFAPKGWGSFTGDLLVGNFGDGLISVFKDSHFVGLLQNASHHPIMIDGLWALLPGTETTGGTNVIWFSSGPDDESHGLVGQLIPNSRHK